MSAPPQPSAAAQRPQSAGAVVADALEWEELLLYRRRRLWVGFGYGMLFGLAGTGLLIASAAQGSGPVHLSEPLTLGGTLTMAPAVLLMGPFAAGLAVNRYRRRESEALRTKAAAQLTLQPGGFRLRF